MKSFVKKLTGAMLILALALVFETIPVSVSAAGETASLMAETLTEGDLQYTVSSGKVTVSGCSEGVTALVIPAEIDGMPVTAIADRAFADHAELASLTLPEGLEKLGTRFLAGTAVETLTVPASVAESASSTSNSGTIGALASSRVKELIFAEGRTEIPAYLCCCTADGYSIALETVRIPSTVTAVGNYAFAGCGKLQALALPEGLTSVGTGAFEGCAALTALELPASVATVGQSAFRDCAGLVSVVMAEGGEASTVTLEGYAFSNCTSLTSFSMSGSVKKVGASAFANCTSLRELSVPEGVRELGNSCFLGCSQLSGLTLPEGLEKLGTRFLAGTAVETLTIPASVAESGSSSPFSGGSIGALASSRVRELIFAEGCTEIPAYLCCCTAEGYSVALETVKFPATVTSVGSNAFAGCGKLQAVTLPEGLTSIGTSAFRGCAALTALEIPASVTTVGQSAFQDCAGLVSVVMAPGGEASTGTLEGSAFSNCTSLTSFRMSGAVKKVGQNAFEDCTSLRELALPEGVREIGSGCFRGCTELTSLTLPEGLTTLGRLFLEDAAVETLAVPSTMTTADHSTSPAYGPLAGSSVLHVRFAPGLETIPPYFFASSEEHPTAVETVDIPDSVTAVGSYAFYGCTALDSVRLPAGLASIGTGAFKKTRIRDLRVSDEDNGYVLTLIDQGVCYLADENGIPDGEDKYLDHAVSGYHPTVNAVTAAGLLSFSVDYAFREAYAAGVSDLELTIHIPNTEKITADTMYLNGEAFSGYKDSGGTITMKLTEPSGTVSFCIEPYNTRFLMSYARLKYKYGGVTRTETVGIVNMATHALTLILPSETGGESLSADGMAAPNAAVELYVNDALQETVSASARGRYHASLTLPSPKEGDVFKVEARSAAVGAEGESYTDSVADYVKYTGGAVELTRFFMHYGKVHRDLLGMRNDFITYTYNKNAKYIFEIGFSDNRRVDRVFLVDSKRSGETLTEAIYDPARDLFLVTLRGYGYFPTLFYAEYTLKEKSPLEDASFTGVAGRSDDPEHAWKLSHVERPDEKPEFYHLAQYDTGVTADFTDRAYVQGLHDGKTCYLTEEPFLYESEGVWFLIREIYVAEPGGTYTRLRTGVGLPAEQLIADEASAQLQALTAEDDGDDGEFQMDEEKVAESLYRMTELLTNESLHASDENIYDAVTEFVNTALDNLDPNDEGNREARRYLYGIRDQLDAVKLTRDASDAIDKCTEVAMESLDNSDDPYSLGTICEKPMKEIFKSMHDISRKVEDEALRNILDSMMKRKSLFSGQSNLESVINRCRSQNRNMKKTEASARMNIIIDPSGYVYEAVEDNRLSGVTATIYFSESETGENPKLWNAAEYGQENPLTTDEEGRYAWDVPVGYWQVKYEKAGYETAYSPWLPVPPPQLDVNVGLVSLEAPTVALAEIHEDGAVVVFSQYVDTATVTPETVRLCRGEDLIPGTWEALDPAESAAQASQTVATTFRFTPEAGITAASAVCSASGVVNYAGKAMAAPWEETLPVTQAIREVTAEDTVTVPCLSNVTVVVRAEPAAAVSGRKLLILEADPYLLSVGDAAVFDGSGAAAFTVTALLPGESTVRYAVEGSTEKGELRVIAEMEDAAVGCTIYGSLEDESLRCTVCAPAGEYLAVAAQYDGAGKMVGLRSLPLSLTSPGVRTWAVDLSDVREETAGWKLFLLAAETGVPLCESYLSAVPGE